MMLTDFIYDEATANSYSVPVTYDFRATKTI